MATIRTLPDDVARRIAAGEVVERPASVVKELFENAVDAGSRCITVNTAGAGETLIEVSDNGRGMSRDDVEMAPRNFSTSKISSAEDLHRISTYGFRGEALASISSVSQFEILSSDQTKGEGWRLVPDRSTVQEQAEDSVREFREMQDRSIVAVYGLVRRINERVGRFTSDLLS